MGGFDIVDLEVLRLIGLGLQQGLSVFVPIHRVTVRYISDWCQREICSCEGSVPTFHTEVAPLADCSCRAAPAPAFVAIR